MLNSSKWFWLLNRTHDFQQRDIAVCQITFPITSTLDLFNNKVSLKQGLPLFQRTRMKKNVLWWMEHKWLIIFAVTVWVRCIGLAYHKQLTGLQAVCYQSFGDTLVILILGLNYAEMEQNGEKAWKPALLVRWYRSILY